MTELSEIHADLRGLREQGASTTAAIAALDATLRAHIGQQSERTMRRDEQIRAILSTLSDHDQKIDGLSDWRIRTTAVAVAASAAAGLFAPQVTAIVAGAFKG
jgi:hypothetical protein